jgi:RHH-type proline utilization regulon transcriptional repressor/proline dehydrogenase/delta 1-pyrroline-5-carboxylate dehydrogenase
MFKNEPFTDFTIEANRESLASAISKLKLNTEVPCIVNGKEISTGKTIDSVDPSEPDVLIAKASCAGIELGKQAIPIAKSSKWELVNNRSDILRKAAKIMRERKWNLSALIIRESGKTWREADADVAEGIDFCEYYAEQWDRMSGFEKTMEVPGEDNYYFYQPRGVSVVISPWNFPFAIPCGMVVASLVCGNTVILKPAEQSPRVAYELIKILLEAGVSEDALHFLPGLGEEIGDYLVKSPDVAMVVFTGSKAVGLSLIETCGKVFPGQESVKKIVCEMGGKNAIIVDESADIDDAIRGIIDSAFGFAGQKCSACSRLIVVGYQYEDLLSRLGDAVRNIRAGPPKDPATFLSPLIDEEAQDRVFKVIKNSGLKVFAESEVPKRGYFVPATLFKDVPLDHPIFLNELFAPVLAAVKVNSFTEALKIANSSEYALTGGVFSRDPENLERAKREFKVGNLYLNRKITGALVKRQPFGGFKMSGVGSKAGGKDYLLQFVEPRVVTENTIRKGMI